jgi:ABC-type cobalt transport system substrate-binding protein
MKQAVLQSSNLLPQAPLRPTFCYTGSHARAAANIDGTGPSGTPHSFPLWVQCRPGTSRAPGHHLVTSFALTQNMPSNVPSTVSNTAAQAVSPHLPLQESPAHRACLPDDPPQGCTGSCTALLCLAGVGPRQPREVSIALGSPLVNPPSIYKPPAGPVLSLLFHHPQQPGAFNTSSFFITPV